MFHPMWLYDHPFSLRALHGQVHCGMAGSLTLDSKMQGREWLEISLVVGGWFVAGEFSVLFLLH